ncbi:MAG: alginate lyase family protein [Ignavibacteriota bacterium]
MTTLQTLNLSIQKVGILGTLRLVNEKRRKRKRLSILLGGPSGFATLLSNEGSPKPDVDEKEQVTILERAGEMIDDENYFFTFLHHLKGISEPWNFDPIEGKYWNKKPYEETKLRSQDSPKDVKIIWEINRFKYLPLLAEAALASGQMKFVDECEARILSWIDDNPFGATINWSSPLEIAIRGISWVAALRILSLAGFDISANEKIRESLWQHAAYLNAELSTDKIVRSNHLIGETAGLYILSSFLDFPDAVFFRLRAKKILTDSILKQTFSDGASREASSWYHGFICDFADLALRTASELNDQFEKDFEDRFEKMVVYRNSILLPDGDLVKYGDCDFGKAINLSSKWKDAVFGKNPIASNETKNYFPVADHLTGRIDKNYVFVRGGEFGWGGSGFSSHAHDDFLSPIVALDGINIIVDPGTYVYNGSPESRDPERQAMAHNGLIIGENTGAIPKSGFGWQKVRPNAKIEYLSQDSSQITAEGSYGEWNLEHKRLFVLSQTEFRLEDHLEFQTERSVEWNFHFHPRWRVEKISPSKIALHDFRDNHYSFELSGVEGELEVSRYEFFPAYMQKANAWKVVLIKSFAANENRTVKFILHKI